MSDKEPRRRKKRKDSQSRKDDIRTDDHIFMPSKLETKDSDPEVEEEIAVPSCQPSSFAKFVFVILFSGLVLSMSFIFISLHGADNDAISVFDEHLEEHHAEEIDIPHDVIHDDHDDLYDDHDDHHDDHDDPHDDSHDDHDELETWSLTDGIQESIEDIIPGITGMFSFKDDHTEESDQATAEEPVDDLDDHDEANEVPEESSTIQYDTSTEQSITEDVEDQPEEDSITPHIYIETSTEPYHYEAQDSEDSSHDHKAAEELKFEPEEQEPVYTSSSASDSTTQPPQAVPETSYYTKSPDEVSTPSSFAATSDDNAYDEDSFTEPEPQVQEEETFPYYENADITNEDDFGIRTELDELDAELEKSPEKVLSKSEKLLLSHRNSPRLHYTKAQALDKLAEIQRSNKHLEDGIAEYQEVMYLRGVPEKLYLMAGKRAADRMRFRGFMGKSVKLLLEMVNKFPENIELKNLAAVGYLMIGQNKEAKKVLYEVLKIAPESGFAKVHLGFILKTDDSNYEESIKYMSEGIASREAGVIDGRFYFHLGDALHRVGKQNEAMMVYEDAVKEGLFLSAYQRSLYNVNGLTGKPWWNPFSTTYAPYFKLLEKNWLSIRDEALLITNEKGSEFLPEAEGLQEKGDWKQFELFARGKKVEKNCLKVPKTCALISQMPDAANCKRGQVKFSIMRPLTHVWAHTGPTNCRLRAHLGLVVPEGASIRVANETRMWEEGKILLFDDSFEHEVWHNGNASRLVLIVDFWHPELTAYQKRSLTPI